MNTTIRKRLSGLEDKARICADKFPPHLRYNGMADIFEPNEPGAARRWRRKEAGRRYWQYKRGILPHDHFVLPCFDSEGQPYYVVNAGLFHVAVYDVPISELEKITNPPNEKAQKALEEILGHEVGKPTPPDYDHRPTH